MSSWDVILGVGAQTRAAAVVVVDRRRRRRRRRRTSYGTARFGKF